MRRHTLTRLLLAAGLWTWTAGCGTSGTNAPLAPEAKADHIAVLYRNRCGTCHRPVTPGSEPADKLHTALLEHRKRTRLTEQEWRGIEALLAPAPTLHRDAADKDKCGPPIAGRC